MPNCLIKGIQDRIWVQYSDYSGDPEIDNIFLDGSDVDIYDYLSQSMLEKAEESMREDWAELLVLRQEFARDRARYREAGENAL